MSSQRRLDHLLQDSRLWQAGRAAVAAPASVASGWSELDAALGGGWPLGQLTELLVADHGLGEFTLLLPALRRLLAQQQPGEARRWVSLVSPPYVPYAPALLQAGMDLSRLLLVRPRRELDMLWAMEQALHARACAAVVGWSSLADETPLRRLQLAAAAGDAWTVLFRPAGLRSLRSPAPLRLHLRRERTGGPLVIEVLKRRGGRPMSLRLDTGG